MNTPATSTPPTAATATPRAGSPTARFLGALFSPGDRILCRPVETWNDPDGTRRSRVDYKGIQYVRAGLQNGDGTWHPYPEGLAVAVARQAERAEATKANVFFGVCPRFGADGKFDLAWQIRVVRTLWADVDDCTVDEALERCEKAGLPRPSILVNSGNGVHLYWLLSEPYLIDDAGGDPPAVHTDWIQNGEKRKPHRYLIDPATGEKLSLDAKQNVPELSAKAIFIQDVNAGIAAKIGGDSTHDLARILRIPGTLNRKNERNGATPKPCTLVECEPDRRYPIEQFKQYADAAPGKTRRAQLAAVKLPTRRKLSATRQDEFNELLTACAVAPVGDRSDADWHLCCRAVELGQSASDVWAQVAGIGKFAEAGERYFRRTWEGAEGNTREKIFEKATRKANKSERPARNEEGLPHILVDVDEHRVGDEAIQALAAKADNCYQRGGALVHIVESAPPPKGIARPKDAPRIAPLERPRLRELLARFAVWEQPTSEGPVPCHPPDWAVRGVDSRKDWPGIRHLEAVVEAPVFRADGTILQSPGYDPATGLFYRPEIDFEPVPERPSKADVQRARDELLEVVEDFPFGNEYHRSAWLSGVLTPLGRFAFYGPAPLHLVDANVRGCGKSLSTDAIATVVFGRDMARMSVPRDDDEFRKRITAVALAAEPAVLLDNVGGILESASLDAALTGTRWSDRILGRSEMASGVPLIATWYATGNNVALGGDISRRTLHIRLESPEERPEERRDFHHPNLLAWIRRERARLVGAALSILVGYHTAGRPDLKLRPWGGYEAWSDLIRSSIVWCGLPDPGETRQELAELADSEAAALRLLISGWGKIDPEGYGLRVADVLDAITDYQKHSTTMPPGYDEVRGAIIELCPTTRDGLPSTRSVGAKLKHLRRRVVGGRCLDMKPHHSGHFWVVVSPERTESAGSEGSEGSIPATPCATPFSAQEDIRVAHGASTPLTPATPRA